MPSKLEQVTAAKDVPVIKNAFWHRDEILGIGPEDQLLVIGTLQQPEVLAKPRVGRPKGAKKKFSMKSPLINGPDVQATSVN